MSRVVVSLAFVQSINRGIAYTVDDSLGETNLSSKYQDYETFVNPANSVYSLSISPSESLLKTFTALDGGVRDSNSIAAQLSQGGVQIIIALNNPPLDEFCSWRCGLCC